MTTSAIAVSGLRKAFGDKVVLDGIDLDVPAGTVFSLLGPNGAGKTTTVNVLTSVLRSLVAVAAIIGTAFALGFRPSASFPGWLGAIGFIVVVCVATSWLTVALGLAAKTPESAGMATVPLILLPFLSSAIVPADTMRAGFRQFAEYQPFTPIIETLRGLLTGQPSAGHAVAALAWCAAIGLAGYLWALATFRRRA
jgi:ABC-2 type transport system permease protein